MSNSHDLLAMSIGLSLDQFLLRVLDEDYDLSEGENSDEEQVGISSYLGDSINYPNTA